MHPGGPFFAGKDDGAWTIPKGLIEPDEAELDAARRELTEETGFVPPEAAYVELGEIRQKGGKVVVAWAIEGDFDVDALHSNTFAMPWPPRSGRTQSFPEVDRAAWFSEAVARRKINAAQIPFLERATHALAGEMA